MDILSVLFAFVCGMTVRMLGLPPLVGFLLAGFALNFAGIQPDEELLEALAGLGITLMLFTIGLKLNYRDLLRREVLAGTLAHMGLWTVLTGGLLLVAAAAGLAYTQTVDFAAAALLAFALSFSSTVAVIKVLEQSGELSTRHGRLAVGILVMQDIAAVMFLVFAGGKVPSPWAALLLGVLLLRPVLRFLLANAGHGEMLPLAGFVLALGGYELFSAFGVKGDLGALVSGMLLAGHPKATELMKSLLHFKDLFLIGFFLSIGLSVLPDFRMVGVALLICALLPVKLALFFALFTRLRLRARTAHLGALVLANYSEFGLIVAVMAVDLQWLAQEWTVILALAAAFSFVFTSVAYRYAHGFYARHRDVFRVFEHPERLPEDVVYCPASAEVLVIGTGRVGRGALRALHGLLGDRVWGMDANREVVKRQRAAGMNVFVGDAESADVWEAINPRSIHLVLLAVPSVDDCRNIAEQLRIAAYRGPIAAIARYDDERPALLAAGIDRVFNFFSEAGAGFAEDSLRLVEDGRAASDIRRSGEPEAASAM